MTNRYFNNTIDLLPLSKARSSQVEANFSAVDAGFEVVQTEFDAQSSSVSAALAAETAARIASDALMLQANAVWVSGTTYAVGDLRYSPITFQTYRRAVAGAGTTDPSLDDINWVAVGGSTLAQLHAIALSF